MYTNDELIALLGGMDEDAQANWINENRQRLSTENLEFLRTSREAPPLSEASKSYLRDLYDEKISQPIADRESDFITENPGVDADNDGNIDDPELADELRNNESFEAEREFFNTWNIPWDDAYLQRLRDDPQGGMHFDSLEDLLASDWYQEKAAESDPFLRSVLEDAPPSPVYRFQFRGEDIGVPINQVENAQTVFGYDDPSQVETPVRFAASYGLRDEGGRIHWQPVAALWKIFGVDDQSVAPDRDRSSRLLREQADLRTKLANIERGVGPDDGGRARSAYQARLREISQELSEIATGNDFLTIRNRVVQGYQQGFKEYGDEALAFFHAADPSLAARMATDPDNLSEEDFMSAGRLLADAGMTGETADSFGEAMLAIGWVDPYLRKLHSDLAAAGGGSGMVRMAPDPVQVRQNTRDLWRQMFMEEPSEADLDRVAGAVMSAVSGAPDDQRIDPNARIREQLEGSPQHAKYYGNMPSGMIEEQYQQMHLNAQTEMLGGELAGNEPAKAGMMQGDYQTTIGAVLGTSEAWDNSTFMGRLARMSQVAARNT